MARMFSVGVWGACAALAWAACEAPECERDDDCRGRDVCTDGACEDGPDATPEEAADGFCEVARRCQPDSTPEDCEAQTEAYLASIRASADPDCEAYAQALANMYACIEGSDCEGATACLQDTRAVQQTFEACDLAAEGEGEGEGE